MAFFLLRFATGIGDLEGVWVMYRFTIYTFRPMGHPRRDAVQSKCNSFAVSWGVHACQQCSNRSIPAVLKAFEGELVPHVRHEEFQVLRRGRRTRRIWRVWQSRGQRPKHFSLSNSRLHLLLKGVNFVAPKFNTVLQTKIMFKLHLLFSPFALSINAPYFFLSPRLLLQ